MNTIQPEQYGVTVHLFIGTGCSPGKSTFMSSMFTHDHNTNYKGLNSLFPFGYYQHSSASLRAEAFPSGNSFGVYSYLL
jgi:hypothetical protein